MSWLVFFPNKGQSLTEPVCCLLASKTTHFWNVKFPSSGPLKALAPHQGETTGALIVIVTLSVVEVAILYPPV